MMEENLTVIGKVLKVMPIQNANGKAYRQIVLQQTRNKYSNLIALTVWDQYIDRVKEGAEVMAYISIEAKLTEQGSYTNRLKAWHIVPY